VGSLDLVLSVLLISPVILVGAKSLVSGRRVTGREAIACDAVGVLDAVSTTGTLVGRGRRAQPGAPVVLPASLLDHRIVRVMPGAEPGSAP
jgi:hypothetical protein